MVYSTKWKKCHDVVAVFEGGNVDHPDDPGGRTSRGVTQGVYDRYRRSRRQPTQDVYKMTEAELEHIYTEGYWRPVQGEYLPAGVDLAAYDAAVNSGVARASKWLQRAVNSANGRAMVVVDGKIGGQTIGATSVTAPAAVVQEICRARSEFVEGLRTFRVFGRGWSRRIAAVEATGVKWALAAYGLNEEDIKKNLRANSKSAEKSAKMRASEGKVVAGGGVSAGAASVPAGAPEQIVGIIFLCVMIGAVVFFLKARREKARAEAFAAAIEGDVA